VSEPKSEQELMSLAIAKPREGIAAGQSPFGAVIVRGREVVAATHNEECAQLFELWKKTGLCGTY
jgi:tRNA(Arg) A34 adenosine deaminase TadA